jgi:hypothetical protein
LLHRDFSTSDAVVKIGGNSSVSVYIIVFHYIIALTLSLYEAVFSILKITTTTHNDIVCISLIQNLLIATPQYFYVYRKRTVSTFQWY